MVFELEVFIVRLLAVENGAADYAEGTLKNFYSHYQLSQVRDRAGFVGEQRGSVLPGRQQIKGTCIPFSLSRTVWTVENHAVVRAEIGRRASSPWP